MLKPDTFWEYLVLIELMSKVKWLYFFLPSSYRIFWRNVWFFTSLCFILFYCTCIVVSILLSKGNKYCSIGKVRFNPHAMQTMHASMNEYWPVVFTYLSFNLWMIFLQEVIWIEVSFKTKMCFECDYTCIMFLNGKFGSYNSLLLALDLYLRCIIWSMINYFFL